MSQNRTNANRNNNDNGGWNTAAMVGGVLGGIAALAGGYYLYSSGSRAREQPGNNSNRRSSNVGRDASRNRGNEPSSRSGSSEGEQGESWAGYVTGLMQRMDGNSCAPNGNGSGPSRRGVPRSSVPENPSITNMDSLLHDIYLRYIALNDEDFDSYYGVVHNIFLQMHSAMKEADQYYNKYSSTIQFAGSHPDRLRINKPDEFDIDIVIGLPLSIKNNPQNPAESDFQIEPKDPGFVQLKMGVQYERLPQRDPTEWQINRAAYEWKDDRNYLLRSKFMDWFKSVVNRALNKFKNSSTDIPTFKVGGVEYTVRRSESGPAMTMYIENLQRDFKLDVDLVPALRFPIERWPPCSSYRNVPPICVGRNYWMVVPKPNKNGATGHDRNRSWRVAMHEQERELMHNTNNMRQTIRLVIRQPLLSHLYLAKGTVLKGKWKDNTPNWHPVLVSFPPPLPPCYRPNPCYYPCPPPPCPCPERPPQKEGGTGLAWLVALLIAAGLFTFYFTVCDPPKPKPIPEPPACPKPCPEEVWGQSSLCKDNCNCDGPDCVVIEIIEECADD